MYSYLNKKRDEDKWWMFAKTINDYNKNGVENVSSNSMLVLSEMMLA